MSRARLAHIARQLGGEVAGDHILCPGPGHTAADRSLAVWIEGDTVRVHSFAGDDWRRSRDHVHNLLELTHARAEVHREKSSPNTAARRESSDYAARAAELWRESIDSRGTLAQKYLAWRGLTLEPDLALRVLRFHPHCPFGEGQKHPCLIAAFQPIAGPERDTPIAISRIALTTEGEKIDRMFLGSVKDQCVKLDADDEVTLGLHIGEGIETCLAARQLGYRPVWALGSAGAIGKFPVLAGIEALTLLEEDDKTGANATAVEECGIRWTNAGREVLTVRTLHGGDANDALKRLKS